MKKDVIITIKGFQAFDELEDLDDVEFVTSGRFYEREGNYYLTYNESDLTGLGKTTTTLKIENDRVTVMRFGDTHTHMIFEKGRKHLSYYDTALGSFTVGVSTRSIQKRLSPLGGRVEVDYAMEVNSSFTGENAFCVDIREADNSYAKEAIAQ